MRGLVGSILNYRASKGASSSVSSDSTAWPRMFGMTATPAGVEVDEFKAMNLSTVWSCVTGVSVDVAKVPVHIYKRLSPAGRERMIKHAAAGLLLRRPNDEMNAISFRETLQHHALNWGNGYAEIERDGAGRAVALHVMRPDRVAVRRINGKIWYEYTSLSGRKTLIPAEDVFHLKGLSFDGLVGYPVIRVAANSVGASLAADAYSSNFFAKGAIPSGVLEHPKTLKQPAAERIRQEWQDIHGGPDPEFRVAVLEEGMKFTPMQMPLEDAQLLQTRQFSVPDICRWYRYPPHKAFDLSRATFSNIEQQDLSYAGDTLMPWWVRWEQEANEKLLMPSQQNDLYFEHLVDAVLRTDIKTRYDAYGLALDRGWLNRDEVRERENLNPLPDGEGQLFTVQLNQTTTTTLKHEQDNPPTDPAKPSADPAADPSQDPSQDPIPDPAAKPKAARSAETPEPIGELAQRIARAHIPVLEAAYGSLLRVEADKARRAAKRGGLAAWSTEFYNGHRDQVGGTLFPAVESIARSIAAARGMTSLQVRPGTCVRELAEAHVGASTDQLSTNQAPAELESVLQTWEFGLENEPKSRSCRDARAAADRIAAAFAAAWED